MLRVGALGTNRRRSDPATASILLPDPATILPRDDPVTPQITLERSTDVPERSWHAPERSWGVPGRLQDAQNHCPIDKNHGFSGIRKISRLHRFLLLKVMKIVSSKPLERSVTSLARSVTRPERLVTSPQNALWRPWHAL